MKFATGEKALDWLIKNRHFASIRNLYMKKLMDEKGANLQYESNFYYITPSWAEIVDTAIDIEKIFLKRLTRKEQMRLLSWAYDPKILKMANNSFYRAVKKFERALAREGYMREPFEEALIRYLNDMEAIIDSDSYGEILEFLKKAA